jgi:hypothetical protein
MSERSAKLLEVAANRIELIGWSKNNSEVMSNKKACLGTAIAYAQGYIGASHLESDPAFLALTEVIGGGPIVIWNDTECKGEDHAISVLRQAAALVRGK